MVALDDAMDDHRPATGGSQPVSLNLAKFAAGTVLVLMAIYVMDLIIVIVVADDRYLSLREILGDGSLLLASATLAAAAIVEVVDAEQRARREWILLGAAIFLVIVTIGVFSGVRGTLDDGADLASRADDYVELMESDVDLLRRDLRSLQQDLHQQTTTQQGVALASLGIALLALATAGFAARRNEKEIDVTRDERDE